MHTGNEGNSVDARRVSSVLISHTLATNVAQTIPPNVIDEVFHHLQFKRRDDHTSYKSGVISNRDVSKLPDTCSYQHYEPDSGLEDIEKMHRSRDRYHEDVVGR